MNRWGEGRKYDASWDVNVYGRCIMGVLLRWRRLARRTNHLNGSNPPAVITAAAADDVVASGGGRYAAKLTWHSAAEMVIRISSPR